MEKEFLSVEEALNKKMFSHVSAEGLRYLVANCPIKRKPSEADCPYISYLPSFIQLVEARLRTVCCMEIDSKKLNDGTGRKEYYFKAYKPEEMKKPEKD